MMHRAWCCLGEVPYCFSRSSVIFQGHTVKQIVDFDQNWAFPDCNSSLNSSMSKKWCTKLEVILKRCPIVFQGHPSNFKVTRDKKLPILTGIERFRTVTEPWFWNDAQSLTKYRGGAVLFSNVIGFECVMCDDRIYICEVFAHNQNPCIKHQSLWTIFICKQ